MLERSLGTGKIISNASLHSTVSSASSRNLHTLAKNVSPQAKIEKDKSIVKRLSGWEFETIIPQLEVTN